MTLFLIFQQITLQFEFLLLKNFYFCNLKITFRDDFSFRNFPKGNFYFFNLNAFSVTVKLLITIAKLAHIGFIEMPIGFSIPIAIGIIKIL